MKNTKTMLILMLAGTVTFIAGLWAYSTMEPLGTFEITMALLVAFIVIFSLVIGMKRLKDEKKGLTPEDELSKSIKQKAAAMAFMYSFYLWTGIIIFTIDTSLGIEIPIGIGIMGMGLLFIGFWIYYSKTGIDNGYQN